MQDARFINLNTKQSALAISIHPTLVFIIIEIDCKKPFKPDARGDLTLSVQATSTPRSNGRVHKFQRQ